MTSLSTKSTLALSMITFVTSTKERLGKPDSANEEDSYWTDRCQRIFHSQPNHHKFSYTHPLECISPVEEYLGGAVEPFFLYAENTGPRTVLFYLPSELDSQKIEPHYVEFARKATRAHETGHGKSEPHFYAVSCEAHGKLCDDQKVDKFPTLKAFHNGSIRNILPQASVTEDTMTSFFRQAMEVFDPNEAIEARNRSSLGEAQPATMKESHLSTTATRKVNYYDHNTTSRQGQAGMAVFMTCAFMLGMVVAALRAYRVRLQQAQQGDGNNPENAELELEILVDRGHYKRLVS